MKAYQFITMLAVLGLCQAGSAARIAEWNFNDANDLGKDSAGSNHLSAYRTCNAPVYDANGKVGGAARFDDNSAWVTPAGIYPKGSFTFAAFVKLDDTDSNALVATDNRRGGFDLWAGAGVWRTRLFDSDKADTSDAYRIGNAVTTDWTHVAVTFEAGRRPDAKGNYSGTLTFYMDGKKVSGVRTKYAAEDANNISMRMGSFGSTYKLRGLVDEMQLYDTALSKDEIDALANGTQN